MTAKFPKFYVGSVWGAPFLPKRRCWPTAESAHRARMDAANDNDPSGFSMKHTCVLRCDNASDLAEARKGSVDLPHV